MMASRPDERDVVCELQMLDSMDLHIAEQIKAGMKEELNNPNDTVLLNALFDRYVATESVPALDLLINIRESNQKLLFDRVQEGLRHHPLQSLTLLMNLVQRPPSWLYRIAQHPILATVIRTIKSTTDVAVGVSGFLLISSLLPHIPVMSQHHFQDMFLMFMRGANWVYAKSAAVEDTAIAIQMRVAVYALFLRLYGMYPRNLVLFLRSRMCGAAGSNAAHAAQEKGMFEEVIKPMFAHVRMHPAYILGSKEEEFSKERWNRMEPHDVVAECSKVCLDPAEDTWNASFLGGAGVGAQDGMSLSRSESRATFDASTASAISGILAASSSCHVTPIAAVPSPVCTQPSGAGEALSIQINPQGISLPNNLLVTGGVEEKQMKEVNDGVSDAQVSANTITEPDDDQRPLWSPSVSIGLTTPPPSRSRTPTSQFVANAQLMQDGRTRWNSGSAAIRATSTQERASIYCTPEKEDRSLRRYSENSRNRPTIITQTFAKIFKGEKDSCIDGLSAPSSPLRKLTTNSDSVFTARLPHQTHQSIERAPVRASSVSTAGFHHSGRISTSSMGSASSFRGNSFDVGGGDREISSPPPEIAEEADEEAASPGSCKDGDETQADGVEQVDKARLTDLVRVVRRLSQDNLLDSSTDESADRLDDEVKSVISGTEPSNSSNTITAPNGSQMLRLNIDQDATANVLFDTAPPFTVTGSDGSAAVMSEGQRGSQCQDFGNGNYVEEEFEPPVLPNYLALDSEEFGCDGGVSADSNNVGAVQRKASVVADLPSPASCTAVPTKIYPSPHRRHVHSLGSVAALSPTSAAGLPRLTTSSSVAEFMKSWNRFRFNSQCASSSGGDLTRGAVGGGGIMTDSMLSGGGTIDMGSDLEELSEAEDDATELVPFVRRRSMSCPTGVRRPFFKGPLAMMGQKVAAILRPMPSSHGTFQSFIPSQNSSAKSQLYTTPPPEVARSDQSGKLRIEIGLTTSQDLPSGRSGGSGEQALQQPPAPMYERSTREAEAQFSMSPAILGQLLDAPGSGLTQEKTLSMDRFPYLKFLSTALPQPISPSLRNVVSNPSGSVNGSPYDALYEYLRLCHLNFEQQSAELEREVSGGQSASIQSPMDGTTNGNGAPSSGIASSKRSKLVRETSVKDATEIACLKKEVASQQLRIAILRQQLLYEQYKRQIHTQRNRRLFGRVKQAISLEEQNNAMRDQLRFQEVEINNLISALTEQRKENRDSLEEHRTREYKLTQQNRQLMKELDAAKTKADEANRMLDITLKDFQTTRKEFGDVQQRLTNAELELNWTREQAAASTALRAEVDLLQKKLLIASEINTKLKQLTTLPKHDEIAEETLERYKEASRKEVNDLRKNLKRERASAEGAMQSLVELEESCNRKNGQIAELKRLIETGRSSHKEHIQALSLKYNSLLSVCQRQEGHILELYAQLERSIVAPTHGAFGGTGTSAHSRIHGKLSRTSDISNNLSGEPGSISYADDQYQQQLQQPFITGLDMIDTSSIPREIPLANCPSATDHPSLSSQASDLYLPCLFEGPGLSSVGLCPMSLSSEPFIGSLSRDQQISPPGARSQQEEVSSIEADVNSSIE